MDTLNPSRIKEEKHHFSVFSTCHHLRQPLTFGNSIYVSNKGKFLKEFKFYLGLLALIKEIKLLLIR